MSILNLQKRRASNEEKAFFVDPDRTPPIVNYIASNVPVKELAVGSIYVVADNSYKILWGMKTKEFNKAVIIIYKVTEFYFNVFNCMLEFQGGLRFTQDYLDVKHYGGFLYDRLSFLNWDTSDMNANWGINTEVIEKRFDFKKIIVCDHTR